MLVLILAEQLESENDDLQQNKNMNSEEYESTYNRCERLICILVLELLCYMLQLEPDRPSSKDASQVVDDSADDLETPFDRSAPTLNGKRKRQSRKAGGYHY